MRKRTWVVLALLAAGMAQAAVTQFEVTARRALPTAGGPDYELLTGRYTAELDPGDPHNAIINDLALAPRNARGRVEYSATFALAKPVDMQQASGVLYYDTPNRGFGAAVADAAGHVHVISGWQGDLPPAAGRQYAIVPSARAADGSALTGPVLVRWVDVPAGTHTLGVQGGIVIGVDRPVPVTLDTRRAELRVRASDRERGRALAPDDWAFADCRTGAFPGVPDPHRICLKEAVDPRLAYELHYTGKDPLVLGIGFAAVRDLVGFLRRGTVVGGAVNPLAGQIHHAIFTGVSQSGNFVRSFIHLGFNAAEDGSQVFDGAHPQIAARHVPLNFRFAVPGGAASLYEPGSEAPLWWSEYADRTRGRGTTSLLARCSASRTCPKIFESFGAAELWGLRMSPNLVGTDARTDIPLPSNVRRYYFPGVTHGGGNGGFAVDQAALAKVPGCVLPANPNPTAAQVRALNAALVEWVVKGTEPPASRYPLLSRGDLVSAKEYATRFPQLPDVPRPDGKLNEFVAYDFGSSLRANDLSGALGRLPPRIVRTVPSLVVQIDTDGNETAGIPSVQHAVALGTYLGWNTQAFGYYAGAGCGFQGGYVPFARTRAERESVRDPRPSLEERYGTHAAFVARVKAAADKLVAERFLLPTDAAAIVSQAEASQVLR